MSVVRVVPVGEMESYLVEEAARCLAEHLALPVERLPALDEPPEAYEPRRNQYSSVVLMRALARLAGGGPGKVVGLTRRDLSIPMLTFLFGQSQLNGPVAVVSTARLDQAFYSLPENVPLLLERLRKEIIHETGHTFGLIHCPDPTCAMSLSTSIQQVDLKRDAYCSGCRGLLGERVLDFVRRETS